MIFEVECDKRTHGLTDRTHTRIVSFIVLDKRQEGYLHETFIHLGCSTRAIARGKRDDITIKIKVLKLHIACMQAESCSVLCILCRVSSIHAISDA